MAGAPAPNSSRLSNTHCMVRPGSPRNAASVTRRSSQRLTVTMGEAGVASAASNTGGQRRRLGPERRAQAVPGTAQMTARGQIS